MAQATLTLNLGHGRLLACWNPSGWPPTNETMLADDCGRAIIAEEQQHVYKRQLGDTYKGQR